METSQIINKEEVILAFEKEKLEGVMELIKNNTVQDFSKESLAYAKKIMLIGDLE